MNFADKQFGVVDSTQTPQDLIGVPFFSTGASYAIGNPANYLGQLYTAKVAVSPGAWNGANWSPVVGSYVLKTGDTMSGPLTIASGNVLSIGTIAATGSNYMVIYGGHANAGDGASIALQCNGINSGIGSYSASFGGPFDHSLALFSATGVIKVRDKLNIENTTASSSTTTGSLTVAGGVGLQGDLNVGGRFNVAGSATIGIGTGALYLYLNSGNSGVNVGAAIAFQHAGANGGSVGDYSAIIGGAYDPSLCLYSFTGIVKTPHVLSITAATASAGTTTGALTVVGGVGVQGALCVGGSMKLGPGSGQANLTMFAGNTNAGDGAALFFQQGGLNSAVGHYSAIMGGAFDASLCLYGSNGLVRSPHILHVDNATVSSGSTNGALVVTGGVGIGDNLVVGGIIQTDGNQYRFAAGLPMASHSASWNNLYDYDGGTGILLGGSAAANATLIRGTTTYFQDKAGSANNAAFSAGGVVIYVPMTVQGLTTINNHAYITSGGVLTVGNTAGNSNPITSRVNGFCVGAGGYINSRTPVNSNSIGIETDGCVIIFYNDNGSTYLNAGNIFLVGASTAYQTASDIRGKPNRERLSLDLARKTIDALRVWDFDKEGNEIRGVGLIAQEAVAVSKYFGSKGEKEDDWWSSEKAAPMPYVIANIQQLNARMDALEQQIGKHT